MKRTGRASGSPWRSLFAEYSNGGPIVAGFMTDPVVVFLIWSPIFLKTRVSTSRGGMDDRDLYGSNGAEQFWRLVARHPMSRGWSVSRAQDFQDI